MSNHRGAAAHVGSRTLVVLLLAIAPRLAQGPAMAEDSTLAASAEGVDSASAKAERLDETLTRYYENGEFEGAILVADQGEVVYRRGFGLANREWNVSNAPDTKFSIASITKQFTSMLVMMMVQDGRMVLDDPIVKHLPWYREDTGSKITVRHLLQHMSGLPEGAQEWDELDDAFELLDDVPERVRRFCSKDLSFEPGTDFQYSNSDYVVLGAILEAVGGRPFETLLRERILEPLGMHDTGMRRYEAVLPRYATGYAKVEDGYERRLHVAPSLGYAAGGMYSTVEDLFRFDQAILDNTLLSAELTDVMFDPSLDVGITGNYVALGSWVYPRRLPDGRSVKLIERHGYYTPFTLLDVIAPEQKQAIIVFSNVDPARIHELAYAPGLPYDILLILNGLPPEGPGGVQAPGGGD